MGPLSTDSGDRVDRPVRQLLISQSTASPTATTWSESHTHEDTGGIWWRDLATLQCFSSARTLQRRKNKNTSGRRRDKHISARFYFSSASSV
ncbi:hypothetical protein SRHO_G00209130 [Serrasalmus rhombeus]